MDRTAWIVVILCVIGLFAWQWWVARQMQTQAAGVTPSPSPLASPAVVTATAAPAASPASTPASAIGQQMPPFAEKTELLRNNDAELRITNRGGGISEVRSEERR